MEIKNIIDVLGIDHPLGDTRNIINRKSSGLAFAPKGCLVYHHNGKEFVSDKNHALFLPKRQSYTIECRESAHCPLINFETQDGSEFDEFICVPTNHMSELCEKSAQLEKLVTFGSDKQSHRIMSIMYDILSELFDDESRGLCGKYAVLSGAVELLEESYCDPETDNSSLAAASHISEVYFRRLFSSFYGMTPKQYIKKKRLEKSRGLILVEGMNICAVGDACGYRSVYSFSRAFREEYGVSPEQYKKAAAATVQ